MWRWVWVFWLAAGVGCKERPRVPAPREQGPRVLALQPLGVGFSAAWKERYVRGLAALGWRLEWLPSRAFPPRSYHSIYRRHRADRLCAALGRWKPKWASRILGLVKVDISTQTRGYLDHAVFGLADRGGPAAVLSTYRLRHLSGPRFWQAWIRLSNHEIGHLAGLPHCAAQACVMADARASLAGLLELPLGFCTRCQKRFASTSR